MCDLTPTQGSRSFIPIGEAPPSRLIHLGLRVDGQTSMNLASFVTTWMEPASEELIAEALSTRGLPPTEDDRRTHEHQRRKC